MEKPNSSKPYVYINFSNATCAEKAVKTLHMSQLEGSIIKVKHQGAETVNGTAIKVTQLSLKVAESDRMTHCLQFGNIYSVKVINTQPPQAFVTFSNPVEASNAAMSLNHHQFMESMIKWKILGMALRLNTVELDSIAEEHNSDSMQCLRGVVLSWLQQHYDTKKYGEPTWKVLCHRAIEGPAGANEPILAKDIA
eukprot:Em0298g1a